MKYAFNLRGIQYINVYVCKCFVIIQYIPCQKPELLYFMFIDKSYVYQRATNQNWLVERKYDCFASVPNVKRFSVFHEVLQFSSKEFDSIFTYLHYNSSYVFDKFTIFLLYVTIYRHNIGIVRNDGNCHKRMIAFLNKNWTELVGV